MATRFASKWLVLGIDLLTIAVSFVLAYFIRFNLTMNFDVSKLALQLPMAFLITGSYKGVFGYAGVRDVNNIFKAISLSTVIVIMFILINRTLEIYLELIIPLSIIIIYGLLSFVGLTSSHYVLKVVYNAIVNKNLK
jgi:FlaA1/EpsC-like NDP-sugar epimerase